ncbi:hypothetical protein HK100_009165, partial [Physocladia obscura]
MGTDIDDAALFKLEQNVRENVKQWKEGLQWRVQDDIEQFWASERLSWGDSEDCERVSRRLQSMTGDKRFDIILASEILYLDAEHKNLAKTLKKFSHESSAIYVTYKARGLGEERFFRIAEHEGFDVEQVPRDLWDDEF